MSEQESYMQELMAFFIKTFRESWMDNEDWAEWQRLTFEEVGTSYEKLHEALLVGVQNGYSVELQFELFEKLIGK